MLSSTVTAYIWNTLDGLNDLHDRVQVIEQKSLWTSVKIHCMNFVSGFAGDRIRQICVWRLPTWQLSDSTAYQLPIRLSFYSEHQLMVSEHAS